jgi:hypothetical protein
MGFFKGLRDLNKQAHEIQSTWDVGAQLEQAQASMAAANELMAQQTAAANAAMNGVDALATVTAVRQGHGMVNYQPLVEIDLTVMAPGGLPRAVSVTQVVAQVHLPRLQPGAQVTVKVDPANPDNVWINLV